MPEVLPVVYYMEMVDLKLRILKPICPVSFFNKFLRNLVLAAPHRNVQTFGVISFETSY